MKENKIRTEPSYYAIIPASVRYNKGISANAKLMYGEITCLTNKYGQCFATNDYFAQLYDVSERSVQRWIAELRDYDYIKVILKQRQDGSTERKIYMVGVDVKNVIGEGDKNVVDNTTRYNRTRELEGEASFEFSQRARKLHFVAEL